MEALGAMCQKFQAVKKNEGKGLRRNVDTGGCSNAAT